VDHETYEADELARRFHHRLLPTRPLPNGNGRLGRVAADLLIVALDRVPFTWVPTRRPDRRAVGRVQREEMPPQGVDGHDILALLKVSRF
jgi:fido (protein-threonine AMPylation protein)